MLGYFSKWNQWLGEHMFIGVLTALLFGFKLSLPNTPALNTLAIGLFAYMTFITALGTSLKDFIRVLNKPWVPVWALFLIHIVAPLVAWGIGFLFYPHDFSMRLGFLVSASIPIGVTSIIWTSLTSGDVALALVVVTLDTMIVPVWLPAFFTVMVGRVVHIDFLHMLFQLLLMVTIPSLIGMVVNDLTKGRLAEFSKSVGGFSAKIAMFMVVFINAAIVGPEIIWDASLFKMLLVILILVSLGYYLGYLGTYILKTRHWETVSAMVYNVGMRNISFGSVLAVTYFSPAVAVPVTLAMLYQQPLAAIVSYLFRRWRRIQTTH